MRSYNQGITDLYCELTGTLTEKLKPAIAPCLPGSSMNDADLLNEGSLHKHEARILMRCLWLSRLARPLTHKFCSRKGGWTVWEDRQTLRLISYLNSTKDHVMPVAVEPGAKARTAGAPGLRFCVLPIYEPQHIWNHLCHQNWTIVLPYPVVI